MPALATDDARQRRVRAIARRDALKGFDGVQYRRQRITQLMCQHGDEFVHATRGILRFLELPALREVLRHLGKAARCAFRVMERRDHHARPEPFAGFAYSPALLNRAPARTRDAQFPPWF